MLTGHALMDAVRACDSPAEQLFLVTLAPKLPEGAALTPQAQAHTTIRVDFLLEYKQRRLVVEIDGAAFHASAEQKRLDEARDEVLRAMGLEVMRVRASELYGHPGKAAVVKRVIQQLKRRVPR